MARGHIFAIQIGSHNPLAHAKTVSSKVDVQSFGNRREQGEAETVSGAAAT